MIVAALVVLSLSVLALAAYVRSLVRFMRYQLGLNSRQADLDEIVFRRLGMIESALHMFLDPSRN